MIHYSVVPPEELWGEWLGAAETAANDVVEREAGASGTAVCRVSGVPVLVERVGEGRRVMRVLSTDPFHFLDPALMPGRLIAGSGDQPGDA